MADAQTDFGTRLPEKIAGNPEEAKAIGAVFLFKINGDGGGVWTVDCKKHARRARRRRSRRRGRLSLRRPIGRTISSNPGAAMQLYFTGKLKVSGNAMLATKLQKLLG